MILMKIDLLNFPIEGGSQVKFFKYQFRRKPNLQDVCWKMLLIFSFVIKFFIVQSFK